MIDNNYVFRYNEEKDTRLTSERLVSFEVVIDKIYKNEILRTYPHPNESRYPNQTIFEIMIEGYVYVIPAVIIGNDVFLKTIFKSRKATRFHNKGFNE